MEINTIKGKKVNYVIDLDAYYFKSKVDRFLGQKSEISNGPGSYEVNKSGFEAKTYNKTHDGYIGDKSLRFDDSKIRPNIGPGAYIWHTYWFFLYFFIILFYLWADIIISYFKLCKILLY